MRAEFLCGLSMPGGFVKCQAPWRRRAPPASLGLTELFPVSMSGQPAALLEMVYSTGLMYPIAVVETASLFYVGIWSFICI